MTSIARAIAARTNRAMLTVGVGALIAIGAPIPAAAAPFAAPASAELRSEVKQRAGDLRRFYAARDYRPLWLSPSGQASSAVDRLLERLETAQFDALDKRTLKNLRTGSLRRDLDRAAGGKPEAIARVDIELSQMFATYARAMRGAPRGRMLYESASLAPVMPTAESVLTSAAKSPSLDEHITQMAWMHPFYAELRDALISPGFSPNKRQVIWENLSRVRALPAIPAERYVLVDAASARLWMYENGKPVDSMKVVVGKPESETPAMAGFIRYAIVNPYWNVPPDLVQNTIAKGVLSGGTKYLTQRGYEVLANYDANAKPIDPKKVDWQAVAAGAPPPHVRQKPGGSNFMGKVKYEFPNAQGIYLHDTPDRALLKLDDRQLSNGCVRLEDADRLGRWLLGGKSVSKTGNRPEQRIDLPTVVPVYITYLTAAPDAKGTIAFRDDVYGRDSAPQFAALEGVSGAGAYPR